MGNQPNKYFLHGQEYTYQDQRDMMFNQVIDNIKLAPSNNNSRDIYVKVLFTNNVIMRINYKELITFRQELKYSLKPHINYIKINEFIIKGLGL